MNVLIHNFSGVSGDGTYTSDMANRQLYCWYYVYTSSGALHDSVHAAGITNSTFNITKMEFVQAMGSVVDRYKMTGDATFNVFYWPSGTASTQTSIPCTASLTMYL
jgi:hypothetical protein